MNEYSVGRNNRLRDALEQDVGQALHVISHMPLHPNQHPQKPKLELRNQEVDVEMVVLLLLSASMNRLR